MAVGILPKVSKVRLHPQGLRAPSSHDQLVIGVRFFCFKFNVRLAVMLTFLYLFFNEAIARGRHFYYYSMRLC